MAFNLLVISIYANAQIGAANSSEIKDRFSRFELQIDQLSKENKGDKNRLLLQLNGIEKNAENANDVVVLNTFRCYLAANLKQEAAYQAAYRNLKTIVADGAYKNTLLAGIELCQKYGEPDPQKQNQHLSKAFHFIKNSQAATLRYWISGLYLDLAGKQGRGRDAIEAAKIAINVARVNNDYSRQATSLRILAMIEVDFVDKQAALVHIEEAIELLKFTPTELINTEFLLNRAYVLFALKRYDEAMAAYREIEQIAIKQKEEDIPPIVWSNYADIAFAQGNFVRARKEVQRLLAWAQKNENVLMASYAKMTSGLLAIESKNPELAQQLFEEAEKVFLAENMRVEMREYYGNFASTYSRKGYYKQAYKALEQKLELAALIDRESQGHAANELRELLNTEERIKENLSLQTELERNRSNIQRWVFFVLLLLLGLAWSAHLFFRVRQRNTILQSENKELDLQRFQDPLTQLYNRRYVMENVDAIWKKIEAQSATILILDADHFKKINDQYGHPAGDAALMEIARRIQVNLRDSDIVVRWGGEEFLVCSFSCNSEQASILASRILTELQKSPLEFEGRHIPISASIGYVLMPLKDDVINRLSFDEGVKFADAALYLAKTTGRKRAIGIEKINASTSEYGNIMDELHDAAKRGDIELKEVFAT